MPLRATETPPASWIVTPYQKNCAARVAMIEGTPIRATIRPLIYPTRAPAASARTMPSQALHAGSKVLYAQEKAKPDSATTAGKLRSISPAVMTRVSPSAAIRVGGTVSRKDAQIPHCVKTVGAEIISTQDKMIHTTMI